MVFFMFLTHNLHCRLNKQNTQYTVVVFYICHIHVQFGVYMANHLMFVCRVMQKLNFYKLKLFQKTCLPLQEMHDVLHAVCIFCV